MIILTRLMVVLILAVSTLSQVQSATIVPIISILLQDEDECKVGTTVTGYITLRTQADVDALRGVSTVNGSLIFYPQGELDFTPLNQLMNVLVEFGINGGADQTQLIEFNCLKVVGGDFKIVGNDSLTKIDAFANLTSVGEGQNGGNFKIERNSALTNINGFNKLTSVGSSIELIDNYAVKSINAFANLSSLGGNLLIRGNTLLTSIGGFSKLSTMPNGELAIYSNDSLPSINGFEGLSSAIYLSIYQNSALETINGFGSLSSLDTLAIYTNPMLTSIIGFDSLTAAGVALSQIIGNTIFDCPGASLNFSPIDTSSGNGVDCL